MKLKFKNKLKVNKVIIFKMLKVTYKHYSKSNKIYWICLKLGTTIITRKKKLIREKLIKKIKLKKKNKK